MLKNSEKGMALISMILIAGMFAFVGGSMLYGYGSSIRFQKQVRSRAYAKQIVANLQSTLLNDAALLQTIQNNASLAGCLTANGQDCTVTPKGLISVMLANGQLLSDVNPSFGYDWNGRTCNSFSETTPDTQCVFRPEVSWDCDGPCEPTRFPNLPNVINLPIKPFLKFRITMKYSASAGLLVPTINTGVFDSEFPRRDLAETLSSGCTKMGGHMDSTGRCTLSKSTSVCPAWYFLSRYNDNGEIECQPMPMWNTRCPAGNATIGYNSNGVFECFMY